MKKSIFVFFLMLLSVASAAFADGYEWAPVVLVLPESRMVPGQCWAGSSEFSPSGAVVGAVVGGFIGRGIDRLEDNRRWRRSNWAVTGAVTGAVVGMGGGQSVRCDASSVASGFNVTYEYHGQRQTEWMRERPGDVVRVYVRSVVSAAPQ